MKIRKENAFWCDCTKEEKESLVVAFKSLQALLSLLDDGEKVISCGVEYTKEDIEDIRYLIGGIALGRGFKIEG